MSNLQSNNNKHPNDPELIVFDLDYTLWPYHVDSTVILPFCTVNSKIYDKSGQEIKPFPEVSKALEFLKNSGYTLAAASRTQKPPGANQLLDLLDWSKYFSYKEIYPGSKITHFQRFKDQTNLPFSSMLFFDDENRNIQEVSELGVKCVFVSNGLTMKLLQDSIEEFRRSS